MIALVVVLAFVLLGVVAWFWGADSRDGRDWQEQSSRVVRGRDGYLR